MEQREKQNMISADSLPIGTGPGTASGIHDELPEPPWVSYRNRTARSLGGTSGAVSRYPSAGTPTADPRSHRGRNIFLLILSFLLALLLGGAVMFAMIYSGGLANLEQTIREYLPQIQSGALPAEDPAEEEPQPLPEEDPTRPGEAPVVIPMPEERQETFQPIENPPELRIIAAEETGENARSELSIADIAELAKPSVVGVIKYTSPDPFGAYTIGSGIIFSEDGYIITNAHVVEAPYSITVLLNDGTEYEGTLIVADSDADIAILKIDAENLTPAEFGDSSRLRVGEISVAIGCPASVDLQGTTTSGIISALDRVITVDERGKAMRLLQTDAAINPGNSGGPLLNRFGQVIGVNTVKLSSTTYEGLCFAIPSNELEHIVSDLFTWGCVRGYPAIGISARTVAAAEDEFGGSPTGVLVATVNSASGAFGKVKIGDIITHCNGTAVMTVAQINTIKNRLRVGDTITLTVYRRGKILDVDIVLVDQYDLAEE